MRVLPTLLALGATVPTVVSSCSSFTNFVSYSNIQLNDTDFDASTDSVRASEIIDCRGSTNTGGGNCNATTCNLSTEPNQYVRIDRHLNLTVSEEVADDIFDLIRVELPGNPITERSWVYTTGGGYVSICVPQGRSAWWEWSPDYSCVLGSLSGCSNDTEIADGTVIFGCAVSVSSVTVNDVIPRVFGYLRTEEGPSGMSEGPPTNATVDDEQADGRDDASDAASGAGSVTGGSALIALVAAAWLGIFALL